MASENIKQKELELKLSPKTLEAMEEAKAISKDNTIKSYHNIADLKEVLDK